MRLGIRRLFDKATDLTISAAHYDAEFGRGFSVRKNERSFRTVFAVKRNGFR